MDTSQSDLQAWTGRSETWRDRIGATPVKALNQVLADKEIVKRMEEHGADVETSTPEQLGALVKSELAKWKGVVQRAKLIAE